MNHSESNSSLSSGLDVRILRSVVRLVHCLQKERGASCAHFACGVESQPHSPRTVLSAARRDTDQALALLGSRPELPIVSTLSKLRDMMNTDGQLRTAGSKTTKNFHKILVCFNVLIASLVHEYILRHTSQHLEPTASFRRGEEPADVSMTRTRTDSVAGLMPRVRSHQALKALADSAKTSRHRRMRSDNCDRLELVDSVIDTWDPFFDSAVAFDFVSSSSEPPVQGAMLTVDSESNCNLSDGSLNNPNGGVPILVDTVSTTSPKGRNNNPSHRQVSFAFHDHLDDDSPQRMARLLKLLDTFVRLKESTGVERATISSIVAVGNVHSQLLLNDLVLEVENQRKQLDELAKLPVGPLRNLVQELVTLSPEMQALQRRILGGLDLTVLEQGHVAVGKLWDLLTTYIDKLHSLELLIVEEIECCAPDLSSSQGTGKLSDSLQSWLGVNNLNELRRKVDDMSATELKQLILSKVKNSAPPCSSASPLLIKTEQSDTSKLVEDLLNELSTAPPSKEWEIDLYEVRFLRRIGQGNAGTTYLADWSNLKVAVKVASISEMGLDGWRKEVQSLQKLHHPNIIRLLGSVYHPNPLTFCLVLEYCDAGDLSTAIQKVTPRNFVFHVAQSIARGMCYLHNRGIIHRDIKPANVLLSGKVSSGQFDVKVTDFGVATDTNSVEDRTAETGTYRWMAPEVIRHEAYSQTADVYSFSILMWQLLTREDPFEGKSQIEAAAAVAMESARPPFHAETPDSIVRLIQACWSDDPRKRLPFDKISKTLASIESTQLSEDERRWIEAPLGHSVYRRAQKLVERNHGQLQTGHLKQPVPDGKDPPKLQKARSGIRTLFARKSSPYL